MRKVSALGFGCYRVEKGQDGHFRCLKRALDAGVNLIDTSANYGDGLAEELIGDVLRSEPKEKRSAITVVSKFGYIQGQNLYRLTCEGLRFPETVKCGTHMSHCIHPDFMRDQLTRSLERMRLDYIDIFLLHNPEYYITENVAKLSNSDALWNSQVEQLKTEMLRRIAQVFVALEREVQITKRIHSYGISSNSFSLKTNDPCFLPYDTLLSLASNAAAEVSGEPNVPSGFKAVQLPGNLVETEGLRGCVQWASGNGLMVLINRPLNAFSGGEAWRLADYNSRMGVESFETLTNSLLKKLKEMGGQKNIVAMVQRMIDKVLPEATSVLQWENIQMQIRQELYRDGPLHTSLVYEMMSWESTFENLLKQCAGIKTRNTMKKSFHYEIPDNEKLQVFALKFLINYPGVTCVLLGARQDEYVTDMQNLLRSFPTRC